MKKLVLTLCATLVCNFTQPAIDWKNFEDVGYVGGAAAAGIIGTLIATHYYHPAALERAKLEAAQENTRTQEQKDKEERQKQELAEKERAKASISFSKLRQEYAHEVNAVIENNLSREKLTTFIKSKQTNYSSRFADYYHALNAHKDMLHTISVLLSPEEKKQAITLAAQLEEIKHIFNLRLNEDINQEAEEARRIKRHEEAEQRKAEREHLEIKKLKGEVEAQKTVKETHELVKNIASEINSIKQDSMRDKRNTDLQLTSISRQVGLVVEAVKEAIAAGNASFAQRIASIFAKEIEEAKKSVQAALQNNEQQAVPHVIVAQTPPPPFNPAATHLRAPSEAVDSGAMPVPPPSFV